MAGTTLQSGDAPQAPSEFHRQLSESPRLQRMRTILLACGTLEEILEIVRPEAREVTGAARAGAYLLENEAWLRVVGEGAELDPRAERIPVAGTHTGEAVRTGKPVLAGDESSRKSETEPSGVPTDSLLVVPLLVDGAAVGALAVAGKRQGFGEDDTRALSLLADVAAIAIRHVRRRQESQRLAIEEERQRLARELHDTVTQALYSATLYTEAARMALAAGNRDAVAQNLDELQSLTREAMIAIRLLIFELHPPVLEEHGLAEALRIRLAVVETRAGLHAEIHADGGRRLPISIEQDLYGIALEALNNVVKHARAEHVTVRLSFANGHVSLEVSDDGVGYDRVAALQRGGVGLRGMEERARRLDGRLETRTAPGTGTTVKVEVRA